MGLAPTFLRNSRISVNDLSFSYLYCHDLYPDMLDIYFMISLYSYFILCMIRQLALVQWYPFQYSNIFSSMMSIHPKDGGSMRDMVSGFVKC